MSEASDQNYEDLIKEIHRNPLSIKTSSIQSKQSKILYPGPESILSTGFGLRNLSSVQDAIIVAGKKPTSKSMLTTGFGLRNLSSLQLALLDDEKRRQMLEERYSKDEDEASESISLRSFSTPTLEKSIVEEACQAEDYGSKEPFALYKEQLEYLLGIGALGEEEGEYIHPEQSIESKELEDEAKTLAMRKAQKYLRSHKIFEFFQFLIAHLISSRSDNPIEFLVELLDKCLIYRSGLGNPPLLYEKPHLERLFYLMDRMQTGFIELEQYKTGMATLGICSFNRKPKLRQYGVVSKETFVDEAYNRLLDLFCDMIRRRLDRGTSPSESVLTPPPSPADSVQ